MHRPDVRTFGFSLRNTFLEVTVTHPSERRSNVPRGALNATSSSFVEAIWRIRLRTDYAGGPPQNAPFDLIPAMVSTYGGWHPAFAQWWRGAVRTAAERSGTQANPQSCFGALLASFQLRFNGSSFKFSQDVPQLWQTR